MPEDALAPLDMLPLEDAPLPMLPDWLALEPEPVAAGDDDEPLDPLLDPVCANAGMDRTNDAVVAMTICLSFMCNLLGTFKVDDARAGAPHRDIAGTGSLIERRMPFS